MIKRRPNSVSTPGATGVLAGAFAVMHQIDPILEMHLAIINAEGLNPFTRLLLAKRGI